ncbi:UDP-2,3-diacylglucosamine diphosphatase [Beggiatoa alba]|nr:UDP-2,3-diacylglucosamine diphosphatase [Beggiatoa alba]
MTTLFIADLHLSDQRPGITYLFNNFLKNEARQARALYILGDMFEAWLGDDCILPAYEATIKNLKSLSSCGIPVYILHGNRDFLIGEVFCELSGCQLMQESNIITIDGQKYLVMHGDTLCTDDVKYQQFRTMVRDPGWQKQLLQKTPAERMALAKEYREMSQTETADKAAEIMDVNQSAVKNAMRDANITTLIHGHTHRPNIHHFDLDGKRARRIVLGDWYEQGSVLRLKDNKFDLESIT